MKKPFLIIIIFCSIFNLYSQESQKTKEYSFINISMGMEYKKNNSARLTMENFNIVPLFKFCVGRNLRKNIFLSVSFSSSSRNQENKNNILMYSNYELGLFFGKTTNRNNIKIRNQIGFQQNQYSVLNFNKDNNLSNDSFEFRANRFNSLDYFMVYGCDLYSINEKIMNFMGGINAAYAISKNSYFTTNFKERFFIQVHFGVSFSLKY